MSMKNAIRVVSLAVAVLGLSMVVRAHTKLEKTVPADGSTVAAVPSVELVFNEALDLKLTKIEVAGPSGKVELAQMHSMSPKSVMAIVSGKTEDGKYAVTWQTAGDDGHIVKGEFSFSVKHTN